MLTEDSLWRKRNKNGRSTMKDSFFIPRLPPRDDEKRAIVAAAASVPLSSTIIIAFWMDSDLFEKMRMMRLLHFHWFKKFLVPKARYSSKFENLNIPIRLWNRLLPYLHMNRFISNATELSKHTERKVESHFWKNRLQIMSTLELEFWDPHFREQFPSEFTYSKTKMKPYMSQK